MPFNSVLVASTASLSAEIWQHVACLPERVSSDQLLDLVIGFPLRQLGHWALYVWTYLCVSPYPNRPPPRYYDTDDDDSSSGGTTQFYQRRRDYYSSSSSSHSD